MTKKILLDYINRIHTTPMGVDRIKKNLSLDEVDVVEWCKSKIMSEKAEIGIAAFVIQEIPYIIMPLIKPASNPIMNM